MSRSRREEPRVENELDAEVDGARHPSGFQLRKGSVSEPPKKRASSRPPSSRGRWAVVEDFVRDGFRYKIVRRPLASEDETPVLTKREEQALMHARDGHSNKSIAFLLGLAPSTIGVLLFRAAAKLGATSRAQLLAAYARLKKSLDDER